MKDALTGAWVANHQARMALGGGRSPVESQTHTHHHSLCQMVHADNAQAGPWVRLTLPYPPSGNHLYSVAQGRKILSVAGRDYQRAVGNAFLVQRPKPWTPMTGSCQVILGFFPPDQRTRDIDNPVKVILDALTKAGLWGDDGLVDDCRTLRGSVSTTPYVLARIRRVSPHHALEVLMEFSP